MRPLKRQLYLLLAVVVTLTANGFHSAASADSSTPISVTVATPMAPPERLLGIYAGGNPGTAYAAQALRWAKAAGFGLVLNYSSIDATPAAITGYLKLAQQLHLKVIMSLSDLLGTTDLDPSDRVWHRQFGATTDAEVKSIVRQFGARPSVWGFSISDELPGDATSLAHWLPALKLRQRQVAALSHKPTLATLYWSGVDPAFYRSVKSATTDLAIDYYPVPQNPRYGPVSAITTIGQTLHAAAGRNSWFTLQGFGWSNGHHPESQGLGFTKAAAPTTGQMVAMAKQAITAGARNLIVFSYDDNAPGGYGPEGLGDPHELGAIATAARTITTAAWWRAG